MVIGVVGSGAMGTGIAQVAAAAGEQVIIYDKDTLALTNARTSIEKGLVKSIEKGKLTATQTDTIKKNITYASNIAQFANCNLIIEAIVEQLEAKQSLFAQLELIVTNDCILATNTSSLSITAIAAVCKNSTRVVGMHFFNPPVSMPLVEVIPGLTTVDAITDQAKKIINNWGKISVLAKDTPGFIVNRVARSFYGESIRIYEEGLADFATIDWALRQFGGFKMGPFELMDFIGNDVNYKVTETVWEQLFYEPRFKPSLTQKRLVEARLLGRKTGKGYYDYSAGATLPEPDKNDALGTYIFNRVLAMLINEAIDAFYLKLASKEALDLAMEKGVNYPKGLLKWADELGLPVVLKTLTDLQEAYGEDRYRPSVLLKGMVKENRTFY